MIEVKESRYIAGYGYIYTDKVIDHISDYMSAEEYIKNMKDISLPEGEDIQITIETGCLISEAWYKEVKNWVEN